MGITASKNEFKQKNEIQFQLGMILKMKCYHLRSKNKILDCNEEPCLKGDL